MLKLIKKSDDNSIKTVYIDDIEKEPNKDNPEYADGTYYAETIGNSVKIKVIANSEYAKVEFAGGSGINDLEKIVTLDPINKVTEVKVKITSQQGTTIETTIYIKKVSNDVRIKYVKVDTKEAHISEDEQNTYYAYVYDTANKARIQIEAENQYATVVRTDENGIMWLDENGVSSKGTPLLDTRVSIANEETTYIYFKIVAENGDESPVYKLKLEDMSVDKPRSNICKRNTRRARRKWEICHDSIRYKSYSRRKSHNKQRKRLCKNITRTRTITYNRRKHNPSCRKTDKSTNNSKITIRNNQNNNTVYKRNINKRRNKYNTRWKRSRLL